MIVIRKSGRDPDLAEFEMGGETLGTVHRDIEDGEVSFHIHIVILGEDLEREPSRLPGSPAFKGGWAAAQVGSGTALPAAASLESLFLSLFSFTRT